MLIEATLCFFGGFTPICGDSRDRNACRRATWVVHTAHDRVVFRGFLPSPSRK